MKTLAIIPARYASRRFPGKPLADIAGKSMVQRVYEQAQKAKLLDKVVVATDDRRIVENVRQFGGVSLMTGLDHKSGTDRCAEVAGQLPEFDIVINIQGDEPFIHPGQIDLLVKPLIEKQEIGIITLAKRIESKDELFNPNLVKVVFDNQMKALYFSRSPIPYQQNCPEDKWLKKGLFYKHLGLYGFKRKILLELSLLEQSALELSESLEQLRWLENAYPVHIVLTEKETVGIDTPEDLKDIEKYL